MGHFLETYLRHPAIVELRGVGLLYGLILPSYVFAETVRKYCLEKGLMTIGFLSIQNGLRISPPLTITEEEMRVSCDIILEGLAYAQAKTP
jgi:4-aminobutyrate aminotransferase-like enzyme